MAAIPFQHSYPMKLLSPTYTELPSQPNQPPNQSSPPSNPLLQQAKTAHQRLRSIRTLSRALSATLNSIIFSIMAFTISVFLATRLDRVQERNVWPAEAKVWPTVMLLVAALLTLLVELAVLAAYCCGFARAQNSWKLVAVSHAAHFSMWLVVAFLYRYEKRLDDVWGWSCSDVAEQLQRDLNGSLNFGRLCALQVCVW
jgi:cytochrome c biogenesis protein CcdA